MATIESAANMKKKALQEHVNKTYTFTSNQEEWKDLTFSFRKLSAQELINLAQKMPEQREGVDPTPDEANKVIDVACDILASTSKDGYLAEQFKQLDITLLFELFKFLFDISVDSTLIAKGLLNQKTSTLVA